MDLDQRARPWVGAATLARAVADVVRAHLVFSCVGSIGACDSGSRA
jgi:molybdopterin biosynthesis enzyme MoaB